MARSPNDQRSGVKNPNDAESKADRDDRANQMGRGGKPTKGGGRR